MFKHSRLNSYPQHRITLIEVDGPDFEATVSATHAQLQSRKLGKIASLISNSLPNAPVLDSMGKSSHNNAPWEYQCGASSHEQSDLDKSPEDLEKSTDWIFQAYLSSVQRFWRMVQRWNLWSGRSGSGGTIIFTESSCPGPVQENFPVLENSNLV